MPEIGSVSTSYYVNVYECVKISWFGAPFWTFDIVVPASPREARSLSSLLFFLLWAVDSWGAPCPVRILLYRLLP